MDESALDTPAQSDEPSDPAELGGPENPAILQESRATWIPAFFPIKVAEGAVGPLIPVYAAVLGATASLIGVMEFAFSAAAMLGAFVWGRTSDELGKRKPFIVLGLAWTGVFLGGIAFARGGFDLVFLRAGMGFFMAAFVTVSGALLADQSRPERVGSRMGLLNAVGGTGYTAGLLLSVALLTAWGFGGVEEVFLLGGGLGLVSALLAIALVHEPAFLLRRREVHRVFRNVTVPFVMPIQRRTFSPMILFHRPKRSDFERRAWAYLGAILLAFLATGAIFVLLPLYLLEVGASPSGVFIVFLVHAVVSTVAFLPAGMLADRVGYRKVQLSAMAVRAIAILAMALPILRNPTGVAFGLSLVGATFAVLATTGPAALLRGMAIRAKGELHGLYALMSGFGMALGALGAGLVVELVGFAVLFGLAGGVTAAALGVMAVAVYPRGTTG